MSVRPRIDLEALERRVATLERTASISTPVSECRDVRTLQLALEQACRERDEYATESFKDWNRERLALQARVDSLRAERDAAVSALESRAVAGVPEVTTGQPFAVEHTSGGKWWLMFRGSFCVTSYSNGIDADAVCFHLNRHWPAAPREEGPEVASLQTALDQACRERDARDAEIERLREAMRRLPWRCACRWEPGMQQLETMQPCSLHNDWADKRVAEAVALETERCAKECDDECAAPGEDHNYRAGVFRCAARIRSRAPASPAGEASKCGTCGGTGDHYEELPHHPGTFAEYPSRDCPACNGSGRAAKTSGATGTSGAVNSSASDDRILAPTTRADSREQTGASPPPAAPDVDEVEKIVRVDDLRLDLGHRRAVFVGKHFIIALDDENHMQSIVSWLQQALRPLLTAARVEALEAAAKELDGPWADDELNDFAAMCARRIRALVKP